jgi:RimJ/RimL family protein N-acetyltransferase
MASPSIPQPRLPGPSRVDADPLRGLGIRPDDLSDLAALLTDPRVVPTLTPTGAPLTEREIAGRLEAHLWHWDEYGFGTWVFRDARGSFVARAGLERRRVGQRNEVELMYAVAPAYWRRGHGTRVARALVDVAFGVLGLEEIVAFVLPANEGSRRILARCGFTPEAPVVHAGLPHELFRLRREIYRPG